MSRVIHFEIPANDPEKLADFYRKPLAGNPKSGPAQRNIGWSPRVRKANRESTAA